MREAGAVSRAAASPAPAGQRILTLHPGDVAWAEQGDRLDTLLGSCVAIILTDPLRTGAVMCHVVHARPANPATAATPASGFHHGDAAMGAMGTLLRAHAIEPRRCQAYAYGGGNMFPAVYPQANVGEHNARWALAALAEAGIPVLHHDLGGATYRRLSWTVGPELPRVIAVPV
jgi:chemotaxis protein CheD